jgi:hypothetical protein
MRTPYRIDDFQQVYFVIPSLQALLDATLQDFAPIYDRLARGPGLAIEAHSCRLDKVLTVGTPGLCPRRRRATAASVVRDAQRYRQATVALAGVSGKCSPGSCAPATPPPPKGLPARPQ